MSESVEQRLLAERCRTRPDYVVYTPQSLDGSSHDTGNEHFLVFDGPDGSLMAVWTQSTVEGKGDHRIVFARSEDEGGSWSAPLQVAGTSLSGEGRQASWGFPMVSASGRIYVLWNQFQEKIDFHHQFTGTMDARYSDDCGKTWSAPQTVPMPHSPYDHPDGTMPGNWIVWQKPERLSGGKYFVGYTRWFSPAARRPLVKDQRGKSDWWSTDCAVEFMRFDNLDDDPEPEDLCVSYFAWGEEALRVPYYLDPLNTVAQEPSIVPLPDGRLFCVMRTMTGYIWYSVSGDGGETWGNPRPLLRRDHGSVIEQPIYCCPIYQLADGRYVLLHHLRLEGRDYADCDHNRRPAYLALGEFRPDADQPLWFSDSKLLMDNDGVRIGPLKRIECGCYPSFTTRGGNNVLWHPDRKFFLLGKRITDAFLADLSVPERTKR
ncbi:MAG: exo-alpha-sialidase [Victivallales bacterium]|nr:exo-alpha-sialidase [Victivallales bacterium]